VQCSVAKSLLSPPKHDLLNVGLSVIATDDVDSAPAIQVQVFGDEDDQAPTSNGMIYSPDAKNLAPATLRLRAERKNSGNGRVYLIVVKATDASGNVGFDCCTVVVPSGTSKRSIKSANTQAAAAATFCKTHNGSAPAGFFVIGDGPVIGNKQ
jgi:hypothetical protein